MEMIFLPRGGRMLRTSCNCLQSVKKGIEQTTSMWLKHSTTYLILPYQYNTSFKNTGSSVSFLFDLPFTKYNYCSIFLVQLVFILQLNNSTSDQSLIPRPIQSVVILLFAYLESLIFARIFSVFSSFKNLFLNSRLFSNQVLSVLAFFQCFRFS